jgi:hypothetical protein
MNLENTQQLLRDFPRLYRSQRIDPDRRGVQVTLARWDFQCGDGWTELVYSLSRAITDHAQRAGLDISAVQVKEKFGTLRLYVYDGDDVIRNLIGEAERESERTCEICGAPGVLIRAAWCATRCALHRDQRA